MWASKGDSCRRETRGTGKTFVTIEGVARSLDPNINVVVTAVPIILKSLTPRWLLRAAWMAQELLSTFEQELRGVTLIPNEEGGVFDVRLKGKMIVSRKDAGHFPDVKQLKRLVRDR